MSLGGHSVSVWFQGFECDLQSCQMEQAEKRWSPLGCLGYELQNVTVQ